MLQKQDNLLRITLKKILMLRVPFKMPVLIQCFILMTKIMVLGLLPLQIALVTQLTSETHGLNGTLHLAPIQTNINNLPVGPRTSQTTKHKCPAWNIIMINESLFNTQDFKMVGGL